MLLVIEMRLIFDEEYEDVDSSIRNYDDNKYCLFIDSAGSNEAPSTIEVHWHEWLEIVHIIDGHMTTITPSGSFEVGPGDVIVIGMQSLHKIILEMQVIFVSNVCILIMVLLYISLPFSFLCFGLNLSSSHSTPHFLLMCWKEPQTFRQKLIERDKVLDEYRLTQ